MHAFERLAKIQTDHPTVGDVRGLGLMIGVELVKDPENRVQDPEAFAHLQRYCLERELIIIDCGPDGNIIRFIPPLVTTRDELDWAIDLIDAGLSDYEARYGKPGAEPKQRVPSEPNQRIDRQRIMRKTLIGLIAAVLVLTACGETGSGGHPQAQRRPRFGSAHRQGRGRVRADRVHRRPGPPPGPSPRRHADRLRAADRDLPPAVAAELPEHPTGRRGHALRARGTGRARVSPRSNPRSTTRPPTWSRTLSTTVTTFYNQDGPHTFSVYALGIGSQVTDARVPILANLVEHLSQIGFQPARRSRTSGRDSKCWPGFPRSPPNRSFANVQPWPLDVGFDEMADIGFGWRCASLRGREAQALLGVFAGANQVTTWDDGGTEYSIKVRPLFPQQEPCTPVASAG